MQLIESEIKACKEKDYALEFDILSESEIKELNLLNKGSNGKKTKQIRNVERTTEELIELINKGEFNPADIPQLRDLVELLRMRQGE